jgi:hypothetical protein
VDTTATERRTLGDPGTSPVRDGAGRIREDGRGRKHSRLLLALRWLRRKLSRAAGWLRAQIKPAARMIKSRVAATIGKDRGFGFWWLLTTATIALAIGLVVAVLLSPVIGIVAALAVGIWLLVRRSRSAQSRLAASGRSPRGQALA